MSGGGLNDAAQCEPPDDNCRRCGERARIGVAPYIVIVCHVIVALTRTGDRAGAHRHYRPLK